MLQSKERTTNAQRCAEYKEKLKMDPEKYQEYRQKQIIKAKQWRDGRSDEEKVRDREAARLRKQLSRFVTDELMRSVFNFYFRRNFGVCVLIFKFT